MIKFGIGQPVTRLEDPRFITGRGRFVDDIDLPQQCHGVVVMSPHAHAHIKRIDTAKAKAAPGVLAVLTGADVEADRLGAFSPVMPEDMGGPKGYRTLRSILAIGKVRTFTFSVLIAGVANVILSYSFVRFGNMGLRGIVLGTIIAVTLRSGIWLPWYTLRVLKRETRSTEASILETIPPAHLS